MPLLHTARRMTTPKGRLRRREPYLVELGPGEYRWCACGRSCNEPWCDDSHVGTDLQPVRFTIVGGGPRQRFWMCGCRRTRTPPFCDGSHNKLPPDEDEGGPT